MVVPNEADREGVEAVAPWAKVVKITTPGQVRGRWHVDEVRGRHIEAEEAIRTR